jgi:predicted DNA binding CopG/RHH family protein
MPDRKIDFSDIPNSTDAELARARRVGRPRSAHTKQLVAIRLDPRLIVRLKRVAASEGKPYQTLVHDLLLKAVARRAA